MTSTQADVSGIWFVGLHVFHTRGPSEGRQNGVYVMCEFSQRGRQIPQQDGSGGAGSSLRDIRYLQIPVKLFFF